VDEADSLSQALPPAVVTLLRDGRVGRLGTADAAGRPLVVPVCYVFDGRACYTAVDAKPKRTRALRRLRHVAENPRACLTVDHYEEDWQALWWVIVEGEATVLRAGPEAARAVDLLISKYSQYVGLGLAHEEAVVIRLIPSRILHWRGGGAAGQS
jgi:PPOX class probable F420-dependent enzyme